MARTKGSMKLGQNIEPEIGAPLDARLMVKKVEDLTNEKSYAYPYVGMIVMCKEDMTQYILKDKDTTKASSWEVWSTGGGGSGGSSSAEVDLSDYYTKSEVDDLLDAKADQATTYTKTEVDALLDAKADASDLDDYYTKDETYTKEEIDELISSTIIVPEDPDEPEEYEIVTWANGTDSQIVNMLKAAYRGEISLYDYWAVGDERQFSLSSMDKLNVDYENAQPAQTITMVLVESGDIIKSYFLNNQDGLKAYELTTLTTRTHPWFVLSMKNNLKEDGVINTTDITSATWDNSERRTWCNTIFKNSFNETIRPIFKEAKTPTIDSNNGSTIILSSDYFALHAEKELGITKNANATESSYLMSFSYYSALSTRRIKLNNGNNSSQTTSGSGSVYWTRSPATGSLNDKKFVPINKSGDAISGYNARTNVCGFSMIGYI